MSEISKSSSAGPSGVEANDQPRDQSFSLAAVYRREAKRLLGLAASSPLDETKHDFLRLALNYEALAERAAQRG